MRLGKVHVAVVLLMLAVGLLLASFTRSEAQIAAAGGAKATRVAVCNIEEVFNEYQRGKDGTKELNEEGEQIEAENKRRVKKAEELQTQLEGFKPDSQKYDETLQAAQQNEISRQVWLQMKQQEILRRHRRLTEEMFREIRAMVADVAKEKGFDVVLQGQSGDLRDVQNAQQVIAQIERQKVLYNTPEVDITAVVLQRLNEGYQLRNK
ncbi:MAG: OmpH family outer membrane protein [Phycisphaerae bacterium]|nr:OmpH family outer membrane protein [Phycisphaerae bacterium]